MTASPAASKAAPKGSRRERVFKAGQGSHEQKRSISERSPWLGELRVLCGFLQAVGRTRGAALWVLTGVPDCITGEVRTAVT